MSDLIRYNTLDKLTEVPSSNPTLTMLNTLDKRKKQIIKSIIPPNTSPQVKTIVASTMNTIITTSNVVREQTPEDTGYEYTGMSKEQAENHIQEIKDKLDEMLNTIIFLK